jgi:hypothetical protein
VLLKDRVGNEIEIRLCETKLEREERMKLIHEKGRLEAESKKTLSNTNTNI